MPLTIRTRAPSVRRLARNLPRPTEPASSRRMAGVDLQELRLAARLMVDAVRRQRRGLPSDSGR